MKIKYLILTIEKVSSVMEKTLTLHYFHKGESCLCRATSSFSKDPCQNGKMCLALHTIYIVILGLYVSKIWKFRPSLRVIKILLRYK